MLTSRLMIDVDSAGEMLRALAALPLPSNADEAEELVLQTVATAAAALRERPVNERVYAGYVEELLTGWSPRVLTRTRDWFGARLCLAAAQIALRSPGRARDALPAGVSMAELRRAVEDMPRYLAWVASLGYADAATWAPAVAGDLARRLTWWQLSPHPERGAGRLLWMLERTLEPQNHRTRMAGLWRRARAAGFTSPDRINARPRDVDVSAEAFADIVGARADITLEPLVDLELTYRSPNTQARVTAMTSTGAARAVATTRPAQGPIDIATFRRHRRSRRLPLHARRRLRIRQPACRRARERRVRESDRRSRRFDRRPARRPFRPRAPTRRPQAVPGRTEAHA